MYKVSFECRFMCSKTVEFTYKKKQDMKFVRMTSEKEGSKEKIGLEM